MYFIPYFRFAKCRSFFICTNGQMLTCPFLLIHSTCAYYTPQTTNILITKYKWYAINYKSIHLHNIHNSAWHRAGRNSYEIKRISIFKWNKRITYFLLHIICTSKLWEFFWNASRGILVSPRSLSPFFFLSFFTFF